MRLDETIRRAIVAALMETGGNKKAAAKLLGISRTRLYARLAKYGIKVRREAGEYLIIEEGSCSTSSQVPITIPEAGGTTSKEPS